MSGGSFDYLYTAEFDKLLYRGPELLRGMAAFCIEKKQDPGLVKLLFKKAEELQAIILRLEAMQETHADLLKAIEWTASFDWGPDSIAKAYHKLTGETP